MTSTHVGVGPGDGLPGDRVGFGDFVADGPGVAPVGRGDMVGSVAAEEAVAVEVGTDGAGVASGAEDLEGWVTAAAAALAGVPLAAASGVADGAAGSLGPATHPPTKAPINSSDKADRRRRPGMRTTAP